MHADARKLLWDAQQAALRVESYTRGKTFADYQSDHYFRSAVERQFQIIGEALSRLRQRDPDTAAQIAELPRVVAFRNILVHGYATLDNGIVWGIVEADLAPLVAALSRLLGNE
jgi:uncharacterized protein with HEPN domain